VRVALLSLWNEVMIVNPKAMKQVRIIKAYPSEFPKPIKVTVAGCE
jgi:hypothetical protein